MIRLPIAGGVCAAALSGMLLPALHGQAPSQPAGSRPPAGTPIGGTIAPAKADERG
jgi:hypothetical protein